MTATAEAMQLLRQQLGAEVVSDTGPVIESRPLRHGLAAVLIPRGLTAAQENAVRAAYGLPPRAGRRRKAA